ncbi:MAG TPA: DUF4332 domain-containing protein [Anaerolineae bacterium]
MKKVPIQKLKGVTKELHAKLTEHRIEDNEKFFNLALTPQGREELAVKLGLTHEAVLELANRADLARLKGVAGVYSDLLEDAGVDTVKELANRNPENLHAKLLEINTQMQLTKAPPSLKHVEGWVRSAKRRRKFLQY